MYDLPVPPGVSDESSYLHLAQRIAAGDGLTEDDGRQAVFRPPLYPIVLGGVLAVGDRALDVVGIDDPPDRLVPGLVGTVVGTVIVAATAVLGRRRFSAPVGIGGAALLAVWPNQVAVVANIMTEQVFVPLFVAALLVYFWHERPTLVRLGITGILLGLATLARPATWPVLVAVAVLGGLGRSIRWRAAGAAIVVASAGLVIAPWLIHVHAATDHVFLVAAQGQNLCIGNNDDADGAFSLAFPACQWPDGRFADPAADQQLFDEALTWIREHPARQPLLVLQRGVRCLLGDSASIVVYLPPADQAMGARPDSTAALILVVASSIFGLVMVGASIVAIAVGGRAGLLRRSAAGPMVLWGIALLSTALITFGDGRYHDPLDPLMALAVAWLFLRWRAARARSRSTVTFPHPRRRDLGLAGSIDVTREATPGTEPATRRPDPWALDVGSRPSGDVRRRGRLLAALIVGSFGPLARLPRVDGDAAVAALLVVTAIALAVVAATARTRLRQALGGAIVTVAAGVAAHWSVGATTIVILAVGIAVAILVLEADRCAEAGRRPTVAVGPLIVAELVWVRKGSPLPFALIAVAALAVHAAIRRWPRGAGAVDRRLGGAAERAAALVGRISVLLIALPTLYLPGAAASTVERFRPDRTSWRPRHDDVSARPGDAAYPFIAAAPAQRRRRQLTGIALLAAVVIVTMVVVARRDDARRVAVAIGVSPDERTEQYVPLERRPAGAGMADGPDLLDEWLRLPFRMTPDGPTQYVLDDWESRHTNIVDGARRTARPDCDCPRVTVWLVGGSEVFGLGQRDGHTIASELAREGARRGLALDVHNLGVPGWTLWDEYRMLQQRLGEGQRPDLVVFVDGFNDMAYSMIQTVTRGPSWDRPVFNDITGDPDMIADFQALGSDEVGRRLAAVGGASRLGELAGRRYADLQTRVRSMLTDQQIDSAFFFQPDAFAGPNQRDAARFEPNYDPAHVDPLGEVLAAAADVASTEAGNDVIDLRPAFATEPAAVFYDLAHTNERGAATIADALADALTERLRRLARPPAR